MKHKEGLLKAIRYFKSQRALGEAIKASQQQINYWLNNANCIPYKYVLKIEHASNGYVTRYELAPEQYEINIIIDQLINDTISNTIATKRVKDNTLHLEE